MPEETGHGSPFDRGQSDAYYGRRPVPHKWMDPLGVDRRENLTPREVGAYLSGYWSADDRKDWGGEDEQ